MQERGAYLETVGDLAHAVVEHRVARDPQDAMLLPVPADREADPVADDRVAERGTMATRRSGDVDRRPPRRLEPRIRPRRKAASVAREALRSRGRGDDGARRRQQ